MLHSGLADSGSGGELSMKAALNFLTFWIGWPLRLIGVSARASQMAAYVFLGIAALVIAGLIFKGVTGLFSRKPKLNEQEIQKGEQAVKDRNDAELKKILVDSDVREKEIDANVSNAKAATVNAIEESKKKYENMNTSELAAELEKRK